jgi:hypothetical protein
MDEILSKNILKEFNSKDFIRLLCSIAILTQSMLLVVDDSFNLFNNTTGSVLFFKYLINYIISSLFLLLGLLVFVGKKTKITIIVCFTLLFITFIIKVNNTGFIIESFITMLIITCLGLLILVTDDGNVTVDKLFNK